MVLSSGRCRTGGHRLNTLRPQKQAAREPGAESQRRQSSCRRRRFSLAMRSAADPAFGGPGRGGRTDIRHETITIIEEHVSVAIFAERIRRPDRVIEAQA